MSTSPFRRVIVIVLDSVGVGELPDAGALRRRGQQHARQHRALRVPLRDPDAPGARHLPRRAAGRSDPRRRAAGGAYGRMAEVSPGKDSVTGHWELMGLVLDRAFPTFPAGFPADAIREFERRIGRPHARQQGGLGHADHRGPRRRSTCGPAGPSSTPRPTACSRSPRTRTSSPCPSCTGCATIAYEHVRRGHGARAGHRAAVRRRARAVPPHGQPPRLRHAARGRHAARRADARRRAGPAPSARSRTCSPGAGITALGAHRSDDEGMDEVERAVADAPPRAGLRQSRGLRHDVRPPQRRRPGTPPTSSGSTSGSGSCCRACATDDLLVLTADHGNDPTTPSTDHSREYVPRARVRPARAAGRRPRRSRRPSRTSARRWPRSSASARSRTAAVSCRRLIGAEPTWP